MKFKILKDSELFRQLQELRGRGIQCRSKTKEWITTHFGEFKPYCTASGCLWGGLSAIKLDQKPQGWKSVGKKHQSLFAPKANQKTLWKEWGELPKIKESEIKDLLNYGNYTGFLGGQSVWNSMSGIQIKKDIILIDTHPIAKTYVPVDGMVEILESEYNFLCEKFNEITT